MANLFLWLSWGCDKSELYDGPPGLGVLVVGAGGDSCDGDGHHHLHDNQTKKPEEKKSQVGELLSFTSFKVKYWKPALMSFVSYHMLLKFGSSKPDRELKFCTDTH